MKALRISLIHIVFFTLTTSATYFFSDIRLIKIVAILTLVVLLSYIQIKYLKENKSLFATIYSIISLFVVFEFSKFFQFKVGMLPRYDDALGLSIVLSLNAIALYIGILKLFTKP